ncbi:MAG: hypothetical protein IPG82_03355 [Saprospiraceae bacterium]|nr:hypothetical protein [Saprospiraceae bacterium]
MTYILAFLILAFCSQPLGDVQRWRFGQQRAIFNKSLEALLVVEKPAEIGFGILSARNLADLV